MSQTGVRSTVSPDAQRTRISRSPVIAPLLVADDADASVVEWREEEVRVEKEGEKADVLEMRPIDAIVDMIFMVVCVVDSSVLLLFLVLRVFNSCSSSPLIEVV